MSDSCRAAITASRVAVLFVAVVLFVSARTTVLLAQAPPAGPLGGRRRLRLTSDPLPSCPSGLQRRRGYWRSKLPHVDGGRRVRQGAGSTPSSCHPDSSKGNRSLGNGQRSMDCHDPRATGLAGLRTEFRHSIGLKKRPVVFKEAKYADAQPAQPDGPAAIARKALGENHPDTAESYDDVAANFNAQGRYAESQPMYERALAIWRKAVARPSDTARGLQRRGVQPQCAGPVCRGPGHLLERAAQPLNKAAGEEQTPDTATSYNNVAANLIAQREYADAQPLLERALAIRRRALGQNHPDTALSCNNMAANLNAQETTPGPSHCTSKHGDLAGRWAKPPGHGPRLQ